MALAATAALAVSDARADESFRCGKWIASSDMTVQDLLAKCGPPDSRARSTEDVMARNPNTGLMFKTGETSTETWIYERGTTAAPMVVTIVDGRIKSIERKKSR
jgi:hypothetical protein